MGQPADAANASRVIALRAGVPEHVPASTVHRNCASGFEAITQAAERVTAGRGNIFLVGGTENMSRYPLLYNERATEKYGELAKRIRAHIARHDTFTADDFPGVERKKVLNLFHNMMVAGELKRLTEPPVGRYGKPAIWGRADKFPNATNKMRRQSTSHFEAGLEHLMTHAVRGQQMTQVEIAAACGVSRERIRQIEEKALKKLRNYISEQELYAMIDTFDAAFHGKANPIAGRFARETY